MTYSLFSSAKFTCNTQVEPVVSITTGTEFTCSYNNNRGYPSLIIISHASHLISALCESILWLEEFTDIHLIKVDLQSQCDNEVIVRDPLSVYSNHGVLLRVELGNTGLQPFCLRRHHLTRLV